MPKAAYLVSFFITTRVVVDVSNTSLEDDDDFIKVIEAARLNILKHPESYINGDNCESTDLDEESPYNPKTDD